MKIFLAFVSIKTLSKIYCYSPFRNKCPDFCTNGCTFHKANISNNLNNKDKVTNPYPFSILATNVLF